MLKTMCVLAALVTLASACATTPVPVDRAARPRTHKAEIESWRQDRLSSLTSETGWLTLTALYPLEAGAYSLGSSPEADLALPAEAPATVGTLQVDDEAVSFEPAPDVTVTVNGEAFNSPASAFGDDGGAILFDVGSVNFFVIKRGDVRLLRVRDRDHPERSSFAGIESFPIDPAFRFRARFEAYEPVKQIPVANIIGIVSDSPSWGAVVFEHDGETYRIDALAEPGDDELFLIFGDSTSGRETYGAGRYLYVDAPDSEGRVVLDFNKAYNPPCAFTPFATCPLPPRQNRLGLSIAAGEKNYVTDGH